MNKETLTAKKTAKQRARRRRYEKQSHISRNSGLAKKFGKEIKKPKAQEKKGKKKMLLRYKVLIILLIAIAVIAGIFFLKRERDLTIVSLSARASYLNTEQSLALVAAPNLEKMILAAEKEEMCLVVTSGYRSKKEQQIVWDEAEDKSLVAYPGKSEHQTGLAVDLAGCPMIDGIRNDAGERLELKQPFEALSEYQWLLQNASLYGFKQSYTEGNSEELGFPAEPWHWKFNY